MTTNTTLLNGHFLVGDADHRRGVVEKDYPCEYSVMSYLGAATAGQPVGVGELHLPTLLSQEEVDEWIPDHGPLQPGEFFNFEANLIYIPNVGLWLCAPLFTSAREAREWLEPTRVVLAERAGLEPDALPLNIALIRCAPDLAYNACGVDPDEIYETSLFADVIGELTKRARPLPPDFDLDASLLKMLEHGRLFDAKTDFYDEWELPRWLDEMLHPEEPPPSDEADSLGYAS